MIIILISFRRLYQVNSVLCAKILQLCFDLVKDWIMKNPEASICTVEGVDSFKDIAIFQDYHGLPQFRNVIKFSIFL